MRKSDPIIALAISDIHLTLHPPLARAEEPNWREAMWNTLRQVKNLADDHRCVVLCAGDVFNVWNPPHQLVNWALDHLPVLYGVPGNHDLPSHRLEDMHKGAFGTLERGDRMRVLDVAPTTQWVSTTVNTPSKIHGVILRLYGHPFGGNIPKRTEEDGIHILVTHQYLWVPGARYHGAPKEQRLGHIAKQLSDFDVVVVGDNHIGFDRTLKSGTVVANCGTLMRRKSDEARYRPSVIQIHASGKVSRHYLDISKEIITEKVKAQDEWRHDTEVDAFVSKLTKLKDTTADFRAIMLRAMNKEKVSDSVRKVILEAMG